MPGAEPLQSLERRPTWRQGIARRVGGFVASGAIHALTIAALVWTWVQPSMSTVPPASARQPEVVVVAASGVDDPSGLRPLEETAANEIEIPDHVKTLSIQRLSFDVQKIADRAKLLFPFLTPGLALEQFAPLSAARRRLQLSFAVSPAGEVVLPSDRPLAIDGRERQALIDGGWSRRKRWKAFQAIAELAGDYSPSTGDLPAVLQLYREQNGLQIYADPDIRDHRLWATLEIAADHLDFVEFIRDYVAAHPSSKGRTELLLLLDVIVQSNFNAIATLLSIEPVDDLQATRRLDPAAYDLAVELQRYYRRHLSEARLLSADAIARQYDAIRLALLDLVVRSTPQGYRSGDARYLMGEIYWRQGNLEAAWESWNAIVVDPSDSYVTPYSEILATIGAAGHRLDNRTALAISAALSRETSRWRAASYDRLARFGFRFDTF
jgi:hypothetical protein